MFSNIYNSDWNEVFQYRLDRIRQDIAGLDLPTKEAYQAEVISRLNQLIRNQDRMQKLREITRETPALVGGIQANLDILNDDVRAVTSQLLATEQLGASLLNLYASTQTALRQRVRQMVYTPTASDFTEFFIGGAMLDQYTCDVDLNAGVVELPVASQSAVIPASVRVGVAGDGALLETSSLGYLLDGQSQTVCEWNGRRLELIFEFSSNEILNRIRIEPHDYEGLIVDEISTSPDGVFHENVLDELPADRRKIDAASNKFSGEFVVDFTPKETRYLKLVLRDAVGAAAIRLRGITFYSRKFSTNGFVAFKPVQLSAGRYRFQATQAATDQLTSVQHQVSDDGAKFRVIYPNSELDVKGPLWYRLFFQRNDKDFGDEQNPFVTGVQDLVSGPAFTLTQPSVTTDLGGGIYQREILFDNISGSARIKDRVVDGTVEVSVGGVKLGSDGFSVSANILSLKNLPASSVTLRYQTSLAGQTNFSLRKPYYSPYLYDVKFGKIL